MNASGHVNEESLRSYSRRPSEDQLKNCSRSFEEEQNQEEEQPTQALFVDRNVDAVGQQVLTRLLNSTTDVSMNAIISSIFYGWVPLVCPPAVFLDLRRVLFKQYTTHFYGLLPQ